AQVVAKRWLGPGYLFAADEPLAADHLEHRRLQLVTELVLNRREIDQRILLHAATSVGRRSKCTGSSSPRLRSERCAASSTATTRRPLVTPDRASVPSCRLLLAGRASRLAVGVA